MASPSFRLLLFFLFTVIVTGVNSHPSSWRPDSQVLQDLFGSEVSSLLLSQPEVTEGSAQIPTQSAGGGRGLSGLSGMEEPVRLVPRPFLELLMRPRKLRVRGRKSSARGCFGIKMDRIGALSGLGC